MKMPKILQATMGPIENRLALDVLYILDFIAKLSSIQGTEFEESNMTAIALKKPTFQELLSHKDVRTTMIYTHVLNRGGRGVRSPADGLTRDPVE
ncbi:hypothetical protein KOR42_41530 [Thalassoglobus neptunius]|uniref:Tyr recombinase domain-containing protein n=1 Tax=Thalassoglobus neptunius TaxID=1938619 RepID=A0A5C5WAG6_9PLAN|nr:hypothetical protein KOR42_41530 [Thalassoglobus neptunius]